VFSAAISIAAATPALAMSNVQGAFISRVAQSPSETKKACSHFFSPDRKEHPPDFSSGDAEGWQE
jgi:hypothetical protein